MDGRIFHIKEKLLDSLHLQWTIEKLADAVGLSVPHFQKLFKSNVGLPPMTFLQDLRLEKASELLERTFLQIQEIRLQVGLQHDSHFTRDFKKKYGVNPTQYRRRHWEKIQNEKQNGKK
ncbi:MAG: helix-turn-helix transcriptional regulator [Pyrinomonadaceae bacterium]